MACGDVGLREFLRRAEIGLEDVYASKKRCFTELKYRAGLRAGPMPRTKLAAATSGRPPICAPSFASF